MWKFIKYELIYWLKSPMTWIFFLINALLVMGAVSSDSITLGGGVGNVFKNSPTVVQNYYGVMSLISLLMTTAFMNATANRDFQYGMDQFVFSSPIKKRDYFFGKFIGAYLVAIVPILGVSLGALIGPFMPWAQPERFGEVVWNGHLYGILGFALPNIFITGVLLFGLSVIFRNNIVSFVGAMLILVFYIVSSGFVRDIEKEWLASLLDPFGFRPMSIISKYFTVSEKNASAVPLIGWFLYNRLIWIATAFLGLFILYFNFSFNAKNKKAKTKADSEAIAPTALASSQQVIFKVNNSESNGWKSLWALSLFELKAIIKNNTFIILLLIGVINLVASLTSFSGRYGATQYPVTYDVIDIIKGAFYLFLVGFITFYSGVLVWKERDAKINEIQDSTPISSAKLFTSKLIAICASVFLVLLVTIFIGIIAQTMFGYTRYQLDVYAKSILLLDFLSFATLIAISLFFHYLINNRYIAYFVFVVFIAVNSFIWGALKISTKLVQYGETPSIIYSDMNGFGPFVPSTFWFNLYWVIGAVLVSIIAYFFFIRGKEENFKYRWETAKSAMHSNSLFLSISTAAFLACGSYIYYNTLVLNKLTSSDELEQLQIKFEQNYKKYEGVAQPTYYKFDYNIEIFPEERNMITKAICWAKNKSNTNINELYFTMPSLQDSVVVDIKGAEVKLRDDKCGFRIYSLASPLLPNDSIQINIANYAITKGFEDEVSFTQLTQNGTFFNNSDVIPNLGYNAQGEMQDKNKRVKFKLPKKNRSAKLDENNLIARQTPYISIDADWVDITTTITTAADQIAVAPGSLVSSSEIDGRKTFTYKLDQKALNFYSFISARYEVARSKWKDIDIEVYYHKDHEVNVPNMIKSMEKSLDYYTTNYGPYYQKQCRIIEFPRYAGFAQAFPGSMPYSESIGFITDLRDVTKDDIDVVFYVVAHEMGHQYWAHQVCGPDMQGSEMMSEGFAQYSALMVMEKEYGKDKMKKFLKYEIDGYLSGRSNEFEGENPLVKTEGQAYIHYQKASAVMYYLKEMIGEEQVNKALRSLIDTFAYKAPPMPTSMSAIRAFRSVTPDSLQYLITDLFENITIFSNRIKDAKINQKGDEYEVVMNTISEKFYNDSLGNPTNQPLHDYIDIGVFAKGESKENLGKALVYKRVKINEKENTYTFMVKEKPYQVGIDPYNYLIDRVTNDNVKKVE